MQGLADHVKGSCLVQWLANIFWKGPTVSALQHRGSRTVREYMSILQTSLQAALGPAHRPQLAAPWHGLRAL